MSVDAAKLPVRTLGPYASLKIRERRFVDAIVSGKTRKDAVAYAGYKHKQPDQFAWLLLKREPIQDALIERGKQAAEDVGARHHLVLREMLRNAMFDPRKLLGPDGRPKALQDLDEDTAACVASIEIEDISYKGETGVRYKLKFNDKLKALDRIGQYLNMWDAAKPLINVDNRQVHVHQQPNAASEAALRAVNELIGAVRALGTHQNDPVPVQDGSLLPAPVRDEPQGHRASVVDREDSGGPE